MRTKWIRDERLEKKIKENRRSKKPCNIEFTNEVDEGDEDHEAEIEDEHLVHYDCLLGGGGG